FVNASARRLASRLLDRLPDFDRDDVSTRSWSVILSQLRQSEIGHKLLEQLGEEMASAATPLSDHSLLYAPEKTDSGDWPLSTRLLLRKTRRESACSIDDFSLVDHFTHLDAIRREKYLRDCRNGLLDAEWKAYSLAAAAYAAGEFHLSVGA